MISFILNQQNICTDLPAGLPLLDFIRNQQHLKGTKIGCREGDCGACTVLVGSLENKQINYRSVTSCIMPLANAHGKHIVTIEGLNTKNPSRVQQAMVAENGTQCGFCTPGFIVSLAGFCISEKEPDCQSAIAAIDGNICRCTGYKAIARATEKIVNELLTKPSENHLNWLSENNFIPAYFLEIPAKLTALLHENNQKAVVESAEKVSKTVGETSEKVPETVGFEAEKVDYYVGGGTDLLVQKPEAVQQARVRSLLQENALKGIFREGTRLEIYGGTTVAALLQSPEMLKAFPELPAFLKLVSSTQIRNMGTLAGNFANASPIGDLTIFFLALNASIFIRKSDHLRELPLKEFYLGYKTLNKTPEEIIEKVIFEVPDENTHFNFEKVSKRTHLDIASVNSAICIKEELHVIFEAHLAAGGVGPVPKYLAQTSAFLIGKEINSETLKEAAALLQTEIAPISDARGSETYKRLLLRQLFFAHFLKLFPKTLTAASLL